MGGEAPKAILTRGRPPEGPAARRGRSAAVRAPGRKGPSPRPGTGAAVQLAIA